MRQGGRTVPAPRWGTVHSRFIQGRNITDAANGTDAVGRQVALFRSITDAANGTDAGTPAIKLFRSITDAANGTDSIGRIVHLFRSITDAAGGQDLIFVPTWTPPPGRPSRRWTNAVLSDNWRLVITGTVWTSPSPGPQVQILPGSPLTIQDGSLTIDRTSSIRRSGSITLADPIGEGWLPTSLASPIAPNGNELHLSATAIIYGANGITITTDPISLGWFAITDVQVDDQAGDVTMQVTFYDRAWIVSERVFGQGTFATPPGYSLFQMISLIMDSQYPGIRRSISGVTNVPAPTITFAEGDNPWQKMSDALAAGALGYELFMDRDGILTGYPTPDPKKTKPNWTFIEGPSNTASHIERIFTRSGIANDIVRFSSGTQAGPLGGPFRAETQDANPNSPTWVGSQFGRIFNFSSSPFITSQTSAEAVSANDLRLQIGHTDTITIESIPLPFLDIDDVITVTRQKLGISNVNYVIDSINLPFRYDGKMHTTARRVF